MSEEHESTAALINRIRRDASDEWIQPAPEERDPDELRGPEAIKIDEVVRAALHLVQRYRDGLISTLDRNWMLRVTPKSSVELDDLMTVISIEFQPNSDGTFQSVSINAFDDFAGKDIPLSWFVRKSTVFDLFLRFERDLSSGRT